MQDRCLLRRSSLPLIPCNEQQCEWRINDSDQNNCFWVLALILNNFPDGLSIDEIAHLEGISVKETEKLLESAILNFRSNIKYQGIF